jgi:hypothetical protein
MHVMLLVLKYVNSCVRTYGSYDINIFLDLDVDIFVLDSRDKQTRNRVFVRKSGSYRILFGFSFFFDILLELPFFHRSKDRHNYEQYSKLTSPN